MVVKGRGGGVCADGREREGVCGGEGKGRGSVVVKGGGGGLWW